MLKLTQAGSIVLHPFLFLLPSDSLLDMTAFIKQLPHGVAQATMVGPSYTCQIFMASNTPSRCNAAWSILMSILPDHNSNSDRLAHGRYAWPSGRPCQSTSCKIASARCIV